MARPSFAQLPAPCLLECFSRPTQSNSCVVSSVQSVPNFCIQLGFDPRFGLQRCDLPQCCAVRFSPCWGASQMHAWGRLRATRWVQRCSGPLSPGGVPGEHCSTTLAQLWATALCAAGRKHGSNAPQFRPGSCPRASDLHAEARQCSSKNRDPDSWRRHRAGGY